jgi:hypothetical protein
VLTFEILHPIAEEYMGRVNLSGAAGILKGVVKKGNYGEHFDRILMRLETFWLTLHLLEQECSPSTNPARHSGWQMNWEPALPTTRNTC